VAESLASPLLLPRLLRCSCAAADVIPLWRLQAPNCRKHLTFDKGKSEEDDEEIRVGNKNKIQS